MHEMQTIVTDVHDIRPSVCLSRDSTVCGAFMQPLPNYFGLLLLLRSMSLGDLCFVCFVISKPKYD